jgi:hypothetical protein
MFCFSTIRAPRGDRNPWNSWRRGQLYRGSRRRAGDQRDLAFQIPNRNGACHDYS